MQLFSIFFCLFFCGVILAADDIAPETKVDQFVADGPVFLQNFDLAQLSTLGKITAEKSTVDVDPEGYQTTYFEYELADGLTVIVRKVTEHIDGPHLQLLYVKISSSKWQVLHNLQIGSAISKVEQLFGPPADRDGEQWIYDGFMHRVVFGEHNGVLTSIEFIYYDG